MTDTVPRRKYLVDALHEALPALEKALISEGTGRAVSFVLRDAIMLYADDEALAKIVDEVKRETALLLERASASR